MAKKKVRVLVDCVYGKINDVILVDEGEIKGNTDIDADQEAVKYAEKLNSELEKATAEDRETR